MAAAWFLRLTETAATWSLKEPTVGGGDRSGTATVTVSSSVSSSGGVGADRPNSWFLRLTNTANTWGSRVNSGRIAIVHCVSNVAVTYQTDVAETGIINGSVVIDPLGEAVVLVASSVSVTYVRTGVNVNGSATVPVSSAVAVTYSYTSGASAGGTATLSHSASVTATGRHAGQVVAAVQVGSSVIVNFGAGEYPDIPQIIGTMKESTSGLRVPRTRAGKPFFINYYTQPRSVFKVIHECTDTEKLVLENRYSLDRMKSFTFTFSSDGLPYVVNYAESPRYTPIEGTDRWRIESILIES